MRECPVCKGEVVKVSGLWRKETSLRWGKERPLTPRAKLLKPPTIKDVKDRIPSSYNQIYKDISVFSTLAIGIGVFLALIASYIPLVHHTLNDQFPEQLLLTLRFGVMPVILALVAIAAAIELMMHLKGEAEKAELATPILEEAKKRWENLYYCERCDVVIDSISGKFRSLNEVEDLLFEEIVPEKVSATQKTV